ncbi:MAG TPA: hypothetical protein IAB68_02300 [Candidatus Aphodocola excrementigallinarum]|uniref:Uncharacterized protein n=1 Tax=Candidatus Aphodocola excrementigallinarum TaxID=2840670 RepID=A0A9D1IQ19_9FIRM|nr:hypothetical protein [Candidatus Aphodocola excrementigallinarum]
MEKQRKIKVLSVVALIVAVLGLTVAFAALSQTLTINGTANVDAASWDIHFETISSNKNGDATINDFPHIAGTSITRINVTLTKPNDGVEFRTRIVNDGTVDAKIDSVEISPLCEIGSPVESCDWNNDGQVTEEDVQKVNDNLFFSIAYDGGISLKKNDTLNAGETKQINISVAYYKVTNSEDGIIIEEATELPARDLQFNNLSVTINYVQA